MSFLIALTVVVRMNTLEADNVREHRARTNDHSIQNHAQVRLRVHRIVIQHLVVFNRGVEDVAAGI